MMNAENELGGTFNYQTGTTQGNSNKSLIKQYADL